MVNQVVLIGRITRDIELKSTNNGREVCSFNLAVNRNFKNSQGQYEADFINCVAFGQTAKFMSNYIAKGRLISVVGRISTRNYENQQGQRIYVTEVIVDNVNPLESRSDNNQVSNTYQPTPNEVSPQNFMDQSTIKTTNDSPFSVNNIGMDITDDDLPF